VGRRPSLPDRVLGPWPGQPATGAGTTKGVSPVDRSCIRTVGPCVWREGIPFPRGSRSSAHWRSSVRESPVSCVFLAAVAAGTASRCFEANDYLGGHTHTHDIALSGRRYRVDTGFIVYSPLHYPLLTRLFAELGVESQPTTMSFFRSQRGHRPRITMPRALAGMFLPAPETSCRRASSA